MLLLTSFSYMSVIMMIDQWRDTKLIQCIWLLASHLYPQLQMALPYDIKVTSHQMNSFLGVLGMTFIILLYIVTIYPF